MKLYRHEDGHFCATQEEAKAYKRESGSAFEKAEVPTGNGREALADFLNETFNAGWNAAEAAAERRKPDPISGGYQRPETAASEDRPMNPDVGMSEDGHPNRRCAHTVTQVEACVSPSKSQHVQDLCYHVSKLAGRDLGLVALEVSARLKGIGEIAAEKDAHRLAGGA